MSAVVRVAEQIGDTILFEFRKNLKKWIVLLILTGILIYLNTALMNSLAEYLGMENPEKIGDYLKTQFTMMSLLLQICGAALFGGIIVEDIEKRTGNILHPKISKDRLIVGRFIALYIILASLVILYYTVVVIFAVSEYPGQEVPKVVWESMGWAMFNGLAVAAFVTFISSFSKTVNLSIILSLAMFIIVFPTITTVMSMTGSDIEPLFLLPYNMNIIESIFKMPDPRYMEIPIDMSDMGTATYFIWTTPSVEGAAWSLSIHTVVCLVLAYLLYQRKE